MKRTPAVALLVAAACSGQISGGDGGDDGSGALDGRVDPGRPDADPAAPDADPAAPDADPAAPDADPAAPDASPPGPMGRGAQVPWLEYEAEDGRTTGQVVGPGRAIGTQAGEASGRRAVVLDATGEYVEWTTRARANAIVLRHSTPDAPAGGGLRSTLSLYVDGQKRGTLALSSKEAWIYGDEVNPTNSPSAGPPRRIYTESHRLLDQAIPAGATVRLQKDADDRAAYYALDFIDLEDVAPPLGRPAGYISITDGGHPWAPAVADDGVADDEAFRRCIEVARSGEYAGVYLPLGTFDQNQKILAHGTTIQGAGMWHTVLRNGNLAEGDRGDTGFVITGDRAHFRDFAVFGATDGLRLQGGKAFANSAFNDALLENLWIENVLSGYWVGGNDPSNRLVIRNSRFRNTGADAVNLCNGTADSVVENSHARNTGDDAFAIWSARDLYPQPDRNNVIRNSTAQITWRAAGFAIYGGVGNRIENSAVYDTITYPGLTVATSFDPYPMESATIDGLTLVRTGGAFFGGQEFGAIWLFSAQSPTPGITIRNVDIIEPTYSGIHIQSEGTGSLGNARLENIAIVRPTTFGIQIKAGALGSATFSNVTVEGAGTAAAANQAGAGFTVTDGGGNNW
jgi:hypothetical protein